MSLNFSTDLAIVITPLANFSKPGPIVPKLVLVSPNAFKPGATVVINDTNLSCVSLLIPLILVITPSVPTKASRPSTNGFTLLPIVSESPVLFLPKSPNAVPILEMKFLKFSMEVSETVSMLPKIVIMSWNESQSSEMKSAVSDGSTSLSKALLIFLIEPATEARPFAIPVKAFSALVISFSSWFQVT